MIPYIRDKMDKMVPPRFHTRAYVGSGAGGVYFITHGEQPGRPGGIGAGGSRVKRNPRPAPGGPGTQGARGAAGPGSARGRGSPRRGRARGDPHCPGPGRGSIHFLTYSFVGRLVFISALRLTSIARALRRPSFFATSRVAYSLVFCACFSVIPLARSNFVSLALNFINRQPRGSGTGPALTGVIDQGRGSKVWGSR